MAELKELITAAEAGSLDEVKRFLQDTPGLVHQRDDAGATALHYAAFCGQSDAALILIESGADINARDERFGATPAGWAIEYLREMGGLLGIEIADLEFAISRNDVDWAKRFLKRFPALREARKQDGTPLRELASRSANPELVQLFL